MRLSAGSQEKAIQAAATLQATLSEAENPVPDHFPAVLNLLNNIKTDEVLPRVVFPGTNDDKQLLSIACGVADRKRDCKSQTTAHG